MTGIPPLLALSAYYARKAHRTEIDLAVLRGEVHSDRVTSLQRHTETLEVMREMRDDMREVRKAVTSHHAD